MRRAQIHAQVLVYILAIVILSLVLTLGYKAIQGLREQNDDTVRIEFQRKVIAGVKDLEYDRGSMKKKEFRVPDGFREVCFVDLDKALDPGTNEIINNSVDTGAKSNVFLCPPCTQTFYAGNITTDPNPLCTRIQNSRINVWFEGEGAGVVRIKE